jgi:ribonuclease G
LNNELVISSSPNGDRIALIQEKRLIEYHFEEKGTKFNVGDIYLGTVKKLSEGLNAAFVDIGHEKDAFLHYLDLGPQVKTLNKFTNALISQKNASYKMGSYKAEADIDKLGKITEVLTKNQQILVQVSKEPISTKGPRLACELSLAGRYLVLCPFSHSGVNVSRKISDREERNRLAKIVSAVKPDQCSIIVRTVAAGKSSEELLKDLDNLVKKWEDGIKVLRNAKPRDIIIGEMNRASSILRDLLNESFDSITCDSEEMFYDIKNYIHEIAPEKEKIVKLHAGKQKLFEQTGIEKQLKTLFGKTVSLPSGGYLVIEHTEALHVIDVNSGSSATHNAMEDQESTALKVNLEAIREIARQLRLRDLGGIICIDFIDQRKIENKKRVYDEMRKELAGERAKHTVLPLSKFGVMQITRQRVRPDIAVVTTETCPTCGGTGTISASISVADTIEQNLDYVLRKQNEKKITIQLHPYLFSYFTKGIISKQVRWWFKYGKWISLSQDSSLGVVDFKMINQNGDEIALL